MADAQSPGRGSPSSSMPPKRPLDDEHIPAVSSPLNPDTAPSRSKPRERAPTREQREKKESLKKRESKGASVLHDTRGITPDTGSKRKRKGSVTAASPPALTPLRYKLPPPKLTDYDVPRAPIFTPHHAIPYPGDGEIQFYESSEHVYNRKGFRYTHCIADPEFPSSLYYRQSETEPFHSRINFEDTSSHILFSQPGTAVTTDKGFRMARANVGVREGKWYWECKILSGIRNPTSTNAINPGQQNADDGSGGHVRIGWARREASLDAPVGFDAYSYGLRDVDGQKVHMSRPKDFFPPGESICEGDVIGIEINLPSLSLHRKVVDGTYNPAVDISDELEDDNTNIVREALDIIRDRVPIRYRGLLYFEQIEYHPVKELEDLMNPSPSATTTSSASSSNPNNSATQPPNPNHPSPALRTLPSSFIKIYKNGTLIGTPFSSLLSFLPPASKPKIEPGSGAREGLDDGTLGYYPAVSVFRGGAVELNFGPSFWCPPEDLELGLAVSRINGEVGASERDGDGDISMEGTGDGDGSANRGRPARDLSERYTEQIAEDIVYDLIDEVDFWLLDGSPHSTSSTNATTGTNIVQSTVVAAATSANGAETGIASGNADTEMSEVATAGSNGVSQGGVVEVVRTGNGTELRTAVGVGGVGGEAGIKEIVQEDE
ncbi:MAG: hypothetical protein M1819_001707 [Sarea resinae]|nr:MAG: hypothetical protein M1819_001707 [Sarea resinae]